MPAAGRLQVAGGGEVAKRGGGHPADLQHRLRRPGQLYRPGQLRAGLIGRGGVLTAPPFQHGQARQGER